MMWLGCDLGTSSLKVIVIDPEGRVLHRDDQAIPTDRTADGGAEQDPKDWLDALHAAVSRIPERLRADISGIGVDGHVPSLVAVDQTGSPVTPCIIWQDTRPAADAERLAAELGDAEEDLGTRLPWNASQLHAKAAWLARTAPELVARTRWLLSPKDWLNLRLTGEIATDAWTSKGLLHVGTGAPAERILRATGWESAVIPPVLAPDAPLGTLLPGVAGDLGLGSGITVATGWTDAMTSILAVDAFRTPTGFVLTGTSDIVGTSAEHVSPDHRTYSVPPQVAPLPLAYGPTQLSGGSLLWIARTLSLEVGAALDLAHTASERRPMFVPYLNGERAPLWDAAVRGLFLGLDETHGPAELVAAVIDGIALSDAHVLSTAEAAAGIRAAAVQLGGRGVDHPALLAARSGALQRRLVLHDESHLAALGAARLAAEAAGEPVESAHGTTTHDRDSASAGLWADRYDDYLQASAVSQAWGPRGQRRDEIQRPNAGPSGVDDGSFSKPSDE
ncbi:FGGY-family carbohydrate kinase [Salinibacterium sp. ZJ77]|uniref:xylulokinase n=1 Tax=Salinibacterium sp. ZJ77 TaxID=2708337 RepID=UPI001424143C|nr:FGGY-family carbohydrate kinase [Salinibacterium sp. ZJ77]